MESITKTKEAKRARRHHRIRARVHGSSERPRLAVFRSNRFLSAQLINDDEHKTVLGLSTRAFGSKGTKTEQAKALGETLAKEALKKDISKVVFDRGGYLYMGNIKVFADAARQGGLEF